MAKLNLPKAQPGIDKLHLYTPGDSTGAAVSEIRKLSSNENLYGPSPKAIAAVKEASAGMWRYPSVDHADLRRVIADVNDLKMEQIICGAGSDEILSLIAQAYAGIGDEVIMTEHGFEIYGIVAKAVGAELVIARERERVVDVPSILDAITDKTKIIYIANPSNPTGTMISNEDIQMLVEGVRSDIVIVLDGAYAEFAGDYDGGASFVDTYPNVIMTRTFSKLYGLGGLRIGWGYGQQHFMDTLNRIRGPFNLSSPALAGAKEAMLDQEYAIKCRNNIIRDREYLKLGMRQLGLEVDDSYTNYVLPRFASQEQAIAMKDVLLENGLAVRSVSHYGLPNALRITIGTREDCEQVMSIMTNEIEAKS